jgi:hypothetical protein
MESTGNLWLNLYEAVEGQGVKAVPFGLDLTIP